MVAQSCGIGAIRVAGSNTEFGIRHEVLWNHEAIRQSASQRDGRLSIPSTRGIVAEYHTSCRKRGHRLGYRALSRTILEI